jgi:hypothetical protein
VRRAPTPAEVAGELVRDGWAVAPTVRRERYVGATGHLCERVVERPFHSAAIPLVMEGWSRWAAMSPAERLAYLARMRGEASE